jgi:hypothetical protein
MPIIFLILEPTIRKRFSENCRLHHVPVQKLWVSTEKFSRRCIMKNSAKGHIETSSKMKITLPSQMQCETNTLANSKLLAEQVGVTQNLTKMGVGLAAVARSAVRPWASFSVTSAQFGN